MRKLALIVAMIGGLAGCDTAHQDVTSTSPPSGAPPLFRVKSDASDPVSRPGPSTADRVFFRFDSADLDPAAMAVLQRQGDWMRVHPDRLFLLAGHADERGTREYNLALGARRAAAVRDYLVALGIPAGRFKVTSYGKERPVVAGSTEAEWALNRRVETVIDE